MEHEYFLTLEDSNEKVFETSNRIQAGLKAKEYVMDGVQKVHIHNTRTGKVRTFPVNKDNILRKKEPIVVRNEDGDVCFSWGTDNDRRDNAATYNTRTDCLVISGRTVDEHPVFKGIGSFRKFVATYLCNGLDGYDIRTELAQVNDMDALASFINANYKTWRSVVPQFIADKGWRTDGGFDQELCRHEGKMLVINKQGSARAVPLNNRMEVAQTVSRRMHQMGLSREVMEQRCGVSAQNIYKLEVGLYNPSLDILEKIAGVLEMKVALIEK